MKIKLLTAMIAAFLFISATTILVSATGVFSPAEAGAPVMGVQVVIETDPPGYRGARPTDDKGSAPFAGLDGGNYVVTLKRFTKAAGDYTVSIHGSGGVKKSEVWDADKKDTFKTTITIKGDAPQSLEVAVSTVDAAATPE